MDSTENKIGDLMQFVEESLKFTGVINEVRFIYTGKLKQRYNLKLDTMLDVINYSSLFERLMDIERSIIEMRKKSHLEVLGGSLSVTFNRITIMTLKVSEAQNKDY